MLKIIFFEEGEPLGKPSQFDRPDFGLFVVNFISLFSTVFGLGRFHWSFL